MCTPVGDEVLYGRRHWSSRVGRAPTIRGEWWLSQRQPAVGARHLIPPHDSLSGADHLALLETMQRQGLLGCFALTEKLAGVNSGLGESY